MFSYLCWWSYCEDNVKLLIFRSIWITAVTRKAGKQIKEGKSSKTLMHPSSLILDVFQTIFYPYWRSYPCIEWWKELPVITVKRVMIVLLVSYFTKKVCIYYDRPRPRCWVKLKICLNLLFKIAILMMKILLLC